MLPSSHMCRLSTHMRKLSHRSQYWLGHQKKNEKKEKNNKTMMITLVLQKRRFRQSIKYFATKSLALISLDADVLHYKFFLSITWEGIINHTNLSAEGSPLGCSMHCLSLSHSLILCNKIFFFFWLSCSSRVHSICALTKFAQVRALLVPGLDPKH